MILDNFTDKKTNKFPLFIFNAIIVLSSTPQLIKYIYFLFGENIQFDKPINIHFQHFVN